MPVPLASSRRAKSSLSASAPGAECRCVSFGTSYSSARAPNWQPFPDCHPDFAIARDPFERVLGGDHFRIEPTCDLPRQARNVRAVIGRAVAPSLWPVQQLAISGIGVHFAESLRENRIGATERGMIPAP